MTRVAIVPARGGSKRIPGKNLKQFCGVPILRWPLEMALGSGLFERVVVSTDDAAIAEMATACGAEVPFMRPEALADDFSPTGAVVAHAIESLRALGDDPDPVCCIYATAPFVVESDLRAGLDLLLSSGAQFAFSVTSYAYPIQRALRIRTDGRVEMFQPESFFKRSQDLEEAYHDAGQFYWGWARAWLSGQPMFEQDAVPVKLPRHRVQDIDTPEDWERAEWLFKAQRQVQG